MNEQTKLALINWTGFVSTAIARQANGKDVDWREIVDAQETLATALQPELQDYATQSASKAQPTPSFADEIYNGGRLYRHLYYHVWPPNAERSDPATPK